MNCQHQWIVTKTQIIETRQTTYRNVKELFCPNCDILVSVPYFSTNGTRIDWNPVRG